MTTNVHFSAIAWTKLGEDTDDHKLGFITGGHPDGSVSLWDVAQFFVEGEKGVNHGLVKAKKFLNMPIPDIKFNLTKSNLFVTGGKEILLISIDKNMNMEPAIQCNQLSEDEVHTSFIWNEKVPHILAAASSRGNIYIWDMKSVNMYVQIYDPEPGEENEISEK